MPENIVHRANLETEYSQNLNNVVCSINNIVIENVLDDDNKQRDDRDGDDRDDDDRDDDDRDDDDRDDDHVSSNINKQYNDILWLTGC